MFECAAPKLGLHVGRVIPHPQEKIWRALTEGPLIEQWLMKNDFQPVVGHRCNFRGAPTPRWNGVTDCEVLIVEPYRRLAYTWNASGEEATTGIKSIVTWLFSPAKFGIFLYLTHTGFRTHEEVEEHAVSLGWQRYMSELSRVAGGLD